MFNHIDAERISCEGRRLVFCFGEGGHASQAARLFQRMKPYLKDVEVWTVGDFYEKPVWSDRHIYYPPVRDKVYGFTWQGTINALKRLLQTMIVVGASSTSGVISTGPGFCVVVCAIARLFHKPSVHIETWSRFGTQSMTGKFNYWVCNRFYVQNKEQMRFYKAARYCGLL